MASAAEKAVRRAAVYRRVIGGLRSEGRCREAMTEAVRWLRAEATHAERLRPAAAADLYARLAGQVAGLAEFITEAAVQSAPAARHPQRAARHRLALAQLQEAGQHRQALAGACLWLSSAAAATERADRAGAAAMYSQLADRVITLAEAVPGYRAPARTYRAPARTGRH